MSEESKAVVPAQTAVSVPMPGGSLLPQWWTDAYGPGILYKTSLNTRDPQDRATLLRAINEECVDAATRINTDLVMIGYTLSPASREKDGEVQEWVRTVIHEADGTNIAFGARSIILALQMIEQLDRPSPWRPPLVRRLIADKTDNGGNWYRLIDPPAAKSGPAKAK